jgi:hypothetical protein
VNGVHDRKNVRIRKRFRMAFVAMASLVLVRIMGPEPAQQIVG